MEDVFLKKNISRGGTFAFLRLLNWAKLLKLTLWNVHFAFHFMQFEPRPCQDWRTSGCSVSCSHHIPPRRTKATLQRGSGPDASHAAASVTADGPDAALLCDLFSAGGCPWTCILSAARCVLCLFLLNCSFGATDKRTGLQETDRCLFRRVRAVCGAALWLGLAVKSVSNMRDPAGLCQPRSAAPVWPFAARNLPPI